MSAAASRIRSSGPACDARSRRPSIGTACSGSGPSSRHHATFDHGGPGVVRRLRPDDQAEMSGRNRHLPGLGPGRRGVDGTHRRRRRHRIGQPDEGEDRAGDVGEGDSPVVDHESALEHPILRDQLAEQVGEGGAGESRPALGLHEAANALALLQGLAIGEHPQELEPLLHGLHRVHQLEAEARRPAWDAVGRERLLQRAHPLERAHDELRRHVGRQAEVEVDAAPEGHDRAHVPGPAIGGRLIGEHAALRVAHQVDGPAGLRADRVDGLGDGGHVVAQGALETAFLLLGRAEVDDEGIGAGVEERGDGAGVRGDVPEIGAQHERRHEDHRLATGDARLGP